MEQKKVYRYLITEEEREFKLRSRLAFQEGKGWFFNKADAEANYNAARKVAERNYKYIMEGLEKLRENIGAFNYEAYVFVHDDTGLELHMYMEVPVDGYQFRFYQ